MSQLKCPVCGHDNGATATICAECHSLLGVTTLLDNQTVSDTLRPIDAAAVPTRRAVRQVTPLGPDAGAPYIHNTTHPLIVHITPQAIPGPYPPDSTSQPP